MSEIQNISTFGVTDKSETGVTKLSLISGLLDSLHHADILYCHWKSNEHLDASMSGDTDLDILFEEKQKKQVVQLLERLGFKLFKAMKQKEYKDIEDYLGLDLRSGKVVHVHAHFRLTMGETYLKGYQLNLEDLILKTRVYHQDLGIFTSDPALELTLLYIREALKLRHRDRLRTSFGRGIHYTGNILSEYIWLRKRVTNAQLEAILYKIFDNPLPIYGIMQGEFNRVQLGKLAPFLKKEFERNRLYSASFALVLRWYRETNVVLSKVISKIISSPLVTKRINPYGGFTIAIVGADGSGKSTATASLYNTFQEKLDVYKIYFGRGDGSRSFARKLLSRMKSTLFPLKHTSKTSDLSPAYHKRQTGAIADIYRCVEALIVAFEKKRNLRRMRLAKEKGMLVICDRFPQNQLMGYNDGPLLSHFSASANPFLRSISKQEASVYNLINNNPPDVLIKLIASPEVVERRKPGETSLRMLETKISGIKQLEFPNNCRVVTIDAAQPLADVLYRVREELWKAVPNEIRT